MVENVIDDIESKPRNDEVSYNTFVSAKPFIEASVEVKHFIEASIKVKPFDVSKLCDNEVK